MPTRMLWEKICTSRTLAELSAEEERFFYRLLVKCDDHGRYQADPSILRGHLFARMLDDVTEAAVRQWRDRLGQIGLLDVYEVNDEEYLAVTTWGTYQRRRDSKSKYPAPGQPSNDGEPPQLAASGGSRVVKTGFPVAGSRYPVAGGRGGSPPLAADAPAPTTTTTLDTSHDDLSVPAPLTGFHAVLIGTQDYAPSPAFFEQVTERYGSLDLREEALKMRAWLADPAQNRRHRSATEHFILGWLKRELSENGAAPARGIQAHHTNGSNGEYDPLVGRVKSVKV